MNKASLIKKIVAELESELDSYAKAARAAHYEATHEQSRADNKYDTRGLEASYLARAQSRQAAETEAAIAEFLKLPIREFRSTEPIALGALVEVESGGEPTWYFVGPRGGGIEATVRGRTVLVITPQSPVGQQLMGRSQGDELQWEIAGARQKLKIVSVN